MSGTARQATRATADEALLLAGLQVMQCFVTATAEKSIQVLLLAWLCA